MLLLVAMPVKNSCYLRMYGSQVDPHVVQSFCYPFVSGSANSPIRGDPREDEVGGGGARCESDVSDRVIVRHSVVSGKSFHSAVLVACYEFDYLF